MGLKRALTEPLKPSTMLVTALLAALAVAGWVQRDRWLPEVGDAGYPTQSHPAGVYATSSAAPPRATADDPFVATPAESYPAGEAGITMPPAAAVDGFTAAQVEAALGQVRGALVAARLDRRSLVDRDFEAVAGLLAPSARDHARRWTDQEKSSVVTWYAPGVKPHPRPPRVTGRTTFAGGTDRGIRHLDVTTNYVWAYAFEGSDQVAVVHDQVVWRFHQPDAVRPGDRGMWLQGAQSYGYNLDCERGKTGLLAPPARQPLTIPGSGAPTDEPPANYFDPNRSLDIPNTCGW